MPGHADAQAPEPTTPRNVPNRGGDPNPAAAALRAQFGAAVQRVHVTWGQTTVIVAREQLRDIVRWLRDDPGQQYDYLVDITAVEYRDAELPLEVVWHLRSLPYRRFLRLKVELDKREPLTVASVMEIYQAANWMERECYDMFGITFEGHPDLRRILMWDEYQEGYPLRKDFPLRGRFSRSEQLVQALASNRPVPIDIGEITYEEAHPDLPPDMKQRLTPGGGGAK
jgi:NADH-quinone oxidoreductase subunit C